MATFFQWRFPRTGKPPEVKRVTWLCGPERVLVESAVDFIVADLGRLVRLNVRRFSFRFDAERDVWAEANQYALDPGERALVVIRDAETCQNWEPLTQWIDASRTIPNMNLLLVSNEADFPYLPSKDGKRPLRPYVQQIQKRGSVIRCSMPTGEESGDAIAQWVQSMRPMPHETAKYLIRRTGGELRDIRDVCAMLDVLDGVPGPGVIDELCPQRPADDFVDALLSLDKPAALKALETMPSQEYGQALAFLDTRLGQLGTLREEMAKQKTLRDIGREGRVPGFVAVRFRDVAKHYDPKRVVRCRQALAVVDSAARQGQRESVMEVLVSLW